MFTYCLNHPVAYCDPHGTAVMTCFGDDLHASFSPLYGVISGGSVAYATSSFMAGHSLVDDIADFIGNTSEQTVLASEYVAFYKGCLVIKLPIAKNAFSFGVIVMGDEVTSLQTVKHEYGHYVHMKQIGIPPYLWFAAIPSLIGFWSGVEYNDYYSQPWEYVADVFGEVNRDDGGYIYSDFAHRNGVIYWLCTQLASS